MFSTMKKLVIIIALSLFVHPFLNAQNVKLTTYVEATHITPKTGINVRYVDPNIDYEIGAFYQESKILEQMWMSDEAIRNLPRFYEQTFAGIYFAAPLMERNRFDLKFNVRMGVANKEIFVITPAIMGDLKLTPFIHLGGGIGTRAFKPTLITNLTINI